MSLSPQTRRRQQRLARWARQTPGVDLFLTRVLPRIRRNPVLTDLVWRVFPHEYGAGHLEVPLVPDRHLADRLASDELSRLPVVAVLATGIDEDGAAQLLEEFATAQRASGAFRPLFILDAPVFALARRHGYVLEHLVPADRWRSGEFGASTWQDYLVDRVASILDHYQVWHLVRLTGPDYRPNDFDQALLRALGPRVERARARRRHDPPTPRSTPR